MAGTASKQKPSLSIVRKYSAPPETVWRAWTDPQTLKAWFRPDEAMTTPEVAADVREGGRYHIKMRSPDGEEHDVTGEYREVIVNEKLVFTWAWKSTPERESLVTLTFRPVAEGTELTLVHEGFYDEEARDKHQQGWTGCLEMLQGYLVA